MLCWRDLEWNQAKWKPRMNFPWDPELSKNWVWDPKPKGFFFLGRKIFAGLGLIRGLSIDKGEVREKTWKLITQQWPETYEQTLADSWRVDESFRSSLPRKPVTWIALSSSKSKKRTFVNTFGENRPNDRAKNWSVCLLLQSIESTEGVNKWEYAGSHPGCLVSGRR